MNEIDESPETTKTIVFATMDCLIKEEDNDLTMLNVYGEFAVLCGRVLKMKEGKPVSELRFTTKAKLLHEFTIQAWADFRNKVDEYAKAHPEQFGFNKITKVEL